MQLTHEWQVYDHDYTKQIHDIRTIDGTEYAQCWPNAGSFHVVGEIDNGVSIPESEVTHVKLSNDWLENDIQEIEVNKFPSIGIQFSNNIEENDYSKILAMMPKRNDPGLIVIADSVGAIGNSVLRARLFAASIGNIQGTTLKSHEELERGISILQQDIIPSISNLKPKQKNKGFKIGSYNSKRK